MKITTTRLRRIIREALSHSSPELDASIRKHFQGVSYRGAHQMAKIHGISRKDWIDMWRDQLKKVSMDTGFSADEIYQVMGGF